MIVTDENKEYYLQTMRVSSLTEQWEREQYAAAIKSATEWGRKIDRINKEYYKNNSLIVKYNSYMSRGKRVTKEEMEYVKVNLMIKSINEIAKELGRNYYTIYDIAKQLGVSRNHEFTPQEDAYICKHYKDMSVAQLASKLKMTTEMVYNRARKLGVKKNKTKNDVK